jgi:hypothetical protein
VKQSNPQCEVPQFSEDSAVTKKIKEYFSSALVPTQKEDEGLALIGDEVYKALLHKSRECGRYVFLIPFVISWSREKYLNSLTLRDIFLGMRL